MEPISMLAIIGGMHLARKLKGNSSPAKCRWCGNTISGEAETTACCQNKICPSCVPHWRQAGGKNCVICNTTHA